LSPWRPLPSHVALPRRAHLGVLQEMLNLGDNLFTPVVMPLRNVYGNLLSDLRSLWGGVAELLQIDPGGHDRRRLRRGLEAGLADVDPSFCVLIEIHARPGDAVAPGLLGDVLEPDHLFVLLPAPDRLRPELGELPEKREEPD